MWTRRTVLKALAVGAGSLAAPLPLRHAFAERDPDLILRLTAAPDKLRIRSGPETRVLRFTGQVLRGRSDALKPSSGYLGPTLELRRGERVRIEFQNRMQNPSIIHWHGMLVPDVADGHPRLAVGPGRDYTYEFTVQDPAGTYLYHPHPHGLTGIQVYSGLAGLLIVREPDEADRGLPAGDRELSLVIQDRRVGQDNQFIFAPSMMDQMNGVLGDTILVNGTLNAAFTVAPRTYRLRLANVSNARIYKLAWSDGRPIRVVATDNGLLSSTEGIQTRPYVVLAPFERLELLEDFGVRRSGTEIALMSRGFSSISTDAMMEGMMGGGMGGMMRGMTGDGMMRGMMGPDQGEELLVVRFTVASGTQSGDGMSAYPILRRCPSGRPPNSTRSSPSATCAAC